MGSKPGSMVVLSLLLDRGWDVRAVVVVPTAEREWISQGSLAQFARSKGLRVVEQHELADDERPDFVVSYMFRKRVVARTLAMARRAAVNFHPGPLPEFGGWAFYNVAILENAPDYGPTCHFMDEGFDTGPLIKVRRFPIDAKNETALSLERKTQEEMIALAVDFCEMAESGRELPCQPQEKAKMRYLKRPEFEALKAIPAGADADTIDRYARAFWYPPFEGAYLTIAGQKIEPIPQCVKTQVAQALHAHDYESLSKVGQRYLRGK
jgi:methionyl-tRNA formyltransferase